jgi:hypothetical protein
MSVCFVLGESYLVQLIFVLHFVLWQFAYYMEVNGCGVLGYMGCFCVAWCTILTAELPQALVYCSCWTAVTRTPAAALMSLILTSEENIDVT